MQDYQLIVRISFREMDDIAGRECARIMRDRMSELSFIDTDTTYKLQAIYKDKSPRGISL